MRRIVVRSSPVHGRGVFALTRIGAGETILEYKGKRLSWAQAQRQYARSAAEDGHTFYFDRRRARDRRRAGRQLGALGQSQLCTELRSRATGQPSFLPRVE